MARRVTSSQPSQHREPIINNKHSTNTETPHIPSSTHPKTSQITDSTYSKYKPKTSQITHGCLTTNKTITPPHEMPTADIIWIQKEKPADNINSQQLMQKRSRDYVTFAKIFWMEQQQQLMYVNPITYTPFFISIRWKSMSAAARVSFKTGHLPRFDPRCPEKLKNAPLPRFCPELKVSSFLLKNIISVHV